MKQLTADEYITLKGQRCPNCGDTNPTASRVEAEGTTAWRDVECLSCKATWTDNFKLTGYTGLETVS